MVPFYYAVYAGLFFIHACESKATGGSKKTQKDQDVR